MYHTHMGEVENGDVCVEEEGVGVGGQLFHCENEAIFLFSKHADTHARPQRVTPPALCDCDL